MSEKARPDKAVPVFGLVMVKVSVDVPPTATGLVAKALLIVGGSGAAQP